MNDFNNKSLLDAAIKRAVGYVSEEVVEEYACQEGELVLNKRKVTVKDVPPDVSAVKMLLDFKGSEVNLTDEQLAQEKQRLIKELAELNRSGKKDTTNSHKRRKV